MTKFTSIKMIPRNVEIDYEYSVVELHKIPNEVTDWCYDKFGVPGNTWFQHFNKLYFKSKHDHLMFVLRWS